ncbi:hypothetical protein AVEN_126651-1 [Araneus ventricosus]|uniref:Uncharacterized protein n=1 Tax=Araneus ventricosus TaxID=182803 RepID=A0A4Y2K399_ARAVE|nr:hypothetical protein AVEN_126651-1 [Araneus ventricosus]
MLNPIAVKSSSCDESWKLGEENVGSFIVFVIYPRSKLTRSVSKLDDQVTELDSTKVFNKSYSTENGLTLKLSLTKFEHESIRNLMKSQIFLERISVEH